MSKYKTYSYFDGTLTKEVLDSIKVGDKVYCNDWKQGMIVKAVSKNYIIMANKRFYSICEKLPRKYTYNYAYEGRFTIGPDNYYGYYDYYNASEEELKEALLRLEDGYTYTASADRNEHPNYYDWKKTASPITLEKGEMELGRASVSLYNIRILMTYKEIKKQTEILD